MMPPPQVATESGRTEVRLFASMGHTLRTPLNQILGFAELLVEEMSGPLNDKQSRQATGILHAGERLLDVANDLVMIAKLGAGETIPDRTTSDLALALARLPQSDAADGAQAFRIESALEGAVHVGLDAEWLDVFIDAITRSAQALGTDPAQPAMIRYGRDGRPWMTVDFAAPNGLEGVLDGMGELDETAPAFERYVHGTGLSLVLANAVLRSVGGTLSLAVLSESEGESCSVSLRCSLPEAADAVHRSPLIPQGLQS